MNTNTQCLELVERFAKASASWLERRLDEHDCHLSPMDGCQCEELRAELVQLRKEAK
jgi:hypothetical protein